MVLEAPLPAARSASETCPVSGLPIVSRPEWELESEDGGFAIRLRLVGERIALFEARGFMSAPMAERAARFAAEIIDSHLPEPHRYVHVADYGAVHGVSSRVKRLLIDVLRKRTRLAGLVLYGASPFVQLLIKLSLRLHSFHFPFVFEPSYEAAIARALDLLGDPSAVAGLESRRGDGATRVRSDPSWRLRTGGLASRFEVIEDRILHSVSTGRLTPEGVDAVATLRRRILESTGVGTFPFLIVGAGGVEGGSPRARLHYVRSILAWHHEHPLEALIFYGTNEFLRAATALAQSFLPFDVLLAEDLDAAVALTERRPSPRLARHGPFARRGDGEQQHVEQLLQYLASIEWERDGLPGAPPVDRAHPFLPVFEAIRLVKQELDEVLEERDRAELELRRSRHQLRSLLAHMPEAVLLLDEQRRILLANPAGVELLQLLETSDDGNRLERIGEHRVERLPLGPRFMEEVVLGGDSERVFEMTGNPFEPAGSLLVLREVTQERHVRRQLEQQERLAAVGQLAAGVAHDFNNILQAITISADSLTELTDEPSARDYARAITEQSERGADLIRQILDFSRASISSREPVDLESLIHESLELLRRTLPETIDIALASPPGPLAVEADPVQIQQLITNLALNSRDAMPTGGRLRLGLSAIRRSESAGESEEDTTDPEWVELSISDSGSGIEIADLPKIFEPFFTTKEPGEGTGLGLAQAYGIVQQHQGRIACQSEPGVGTTFTISLPRIDSARLETRPVVVPEGGSGGGATILVVEDDPTIRLLVARSLETLDYRVIPAADGREALRAFDEAEEPISLVISDMVMPHLGGVELQERLRERRPDVKMLMMSGYPLGSQRFEGVRSDSWIQKPFTMRQLCQSVERLIERPERAMPPAAEVVEAS